MPFSPFIAIFGLISIIIGLLLGVWGTYHLWLAIISADWPSVDGVVESYSIKKKTSRSEGGARKYWLATISISYSISGMDEDLQKKPEIYRTQKTKTYSRGGGDTREVVEMDLIATYPKGSKVPVYYNPDKPNQSVLEPGFELGGLFLPLFGLFVFLVGLVLLFQPW
ncbi:MAG: DUF3592 domain-containing protein [Candidatus Heimdallarchaeota archaeon]